ncbi:hypothetical protein AALO_G00294450 [Alosa alosa]|uniref:C-type lectin domain-containing protein n=1 Tax=Alosa alosa TaxID=278164 RepID=A0AAV6FG18_9TELE|nr:flocculation protein FLO11-like isoform X2 [Alosa alosa]KAG5260612.1 hypothetical protein AALO_G00294450 [Alosa alosa]
MFLLLLVSGLCTLLFALPHPYHFVNEPMTWTEAQTHCQTYYIDLATVYDVDDMGSLMQSVDGSYNDSAWIGLYDDTLKSWRWSLENESYYKEGERYFRQWWDKPDNYGGNELCAVMVFDNKWHDAPCDYTFPVICYDGRENINETYVLIPQFMNWTFGQQYCREHHTDLVSIRNKAEYQNIIDLLDSGIAWLGLHRTRSWSDQTNSTFRNWREGEPDNGRQTVEEGHQHCTAVSFNASGKWTDENCTRSLPFICYGDPVIFNKTTKIPTPVSITTTASTTVFGPRGSTGVMPNFGNSLSFANTLPNSVSMVPDSTLDSVSDLTSKATDSSAINITSAASTRISSDTQSPMETTLITTHGTTHEDMAGTTTGTRAVTSPDTTLSRSPTTPEDMVGTTNVTSTIAVTSYSATLSGSLNSLTITQASTLTPLNTTDSPFVVATGSLSYSTTGSISTSIQTHGPPFNQSTSTGFTTTRTPTLPAVPASTSNLTTTAPGIIPTTDSFPSLPPNQTLNYTLTPMLKATSNQTSSPASTHVTSSYFTPPSTSSITPSPTNISLIATTVINQTSKHNPTNPDMTLTPTPDLAVVSASTMLSSQISTPTSTLNPSFTSIPVSTVSTPLAEASTTLSTTDYISVSTPDTNQTSSNTLAVTSNLTTKLTSTPVYSQTDILQFPPTPTSKTFTGALTPNMSSGPNATVNYISTNKTPPILTTSQLLPQATTTGKMITPGSIGSTSVSYGSSLSPSSAASPRALSTFSTVSGPIEPTLVTVTGVTSQATDRFTSSIPLTARVGDTFGMSVTPRPPTDNSPIPTHGTTFGDMVGTSPATSADSSSGTTLIASSSTLGITQRDALGTYTGTTSVTLNGASSDSTGSNYSSIQTHGPPSTGFITSKPTATPADSTPAQSTHMEFSLKSNATSSFTKNTYITSDSSTVLSTPISSPTSQPTSSRPNSTADQTSSSDYSSFNTNPKSSLYSNTNPRTRGSSECHVIGLSATLISERELTQSEMEQLAIEQFGERFRRLGLSSNITLQYIQGIHP